MYIDIRVLYRDTWLFYIHMWMNYRDIRLLYIDIRLLYIDIWLFYREIGIMLQRHYFTAEGSNILLNFSTMDNFRVSCKKEMDGKGQGRGVTK